jgi:hypothetical protein
LNITPSLCSKEEMNRAKNKIKKYAKKIRFHTWLGTQQKLSNWKDQINAKPGAHKGEDYLSYVSKAENEKGNKEKIREKVARRIAESFAKITGYLLNTEKKGIEGVRYWKSFMEAEVEGLELKKNKTNIIEEKDEEEKEEGKEGKGIEKIIAMKINQFNENTTPMKTFNKNTTSMKTMKRRREDFLKNKTDKAEKIMKIEDDFLFKDLKWSFKYDKDEMNINKLIADKNRYLNVKEFKGPVYATDDLEIEIEKRKRKRKEKMPTGKRRRRKAAMELQARKKLNNEYNNKLREIRRQEQSKWTEEWSKENPKPQLPQQNDSLLSFIENMMKKGKKRFQREEKEKEINEQEYNNWYDPSFRS